MSSSPIILTGFEPFGGFRNNPSQQIARQLHGQSIEEIEVISCILPVSFGADTQALFPLIEQLQPRLVLSFGLAAGASCLQVERIALNLRQREGQTGESPILAEAPAAYFSLLDIDAVVEAIRGQGVPAQSHVGAGTYLCNHIMFQLLHLAATGDCDFPSGFIHLPLSSEQALAEEASHRPSLPLSMMTEGVRAAIAAAL